MRYTLFTILLVICPSLPAENWPQVSGPNLNYRVEGVSAPPTKWSVENNLNVRWQITLPEGGQSAVTVWGEKAFLTTHRPMVEDSDRTEPNVIGYCLSASTGEILWQVDLPGTDPVKTAGIFSDATVFAPICDSERVWFFNRCGSMGCFDLQGKQIWLRQFKPRPRHTNRECEPILHGNLIITVEVRNKEAGQKLKRHKPVPDGIDPKDVWTYLHAIDKNTGKVVWVGEPGTSVHNTPMLGTLPDGTLAIVHGRGGGHGPLEIPYGTSLTRFTDGKELWSTELKGNGPYLNSHWNQNYVFGFAGSNHLVLDSQTGKLLRTQNLTDSADFCQFNRDAGTWSTAAGVPVKAGKKFPATKQTNIVVGDWHYFLAHDITAIGRVHIQTGKTEYLQVPAQKAGDRLIWDRKDAIKLDTKNSRGIDIATDKRAKNTGWGHVSAASPVCINGLLYAPVMNGTVYVVDTNAKQLDQNALVAINDLGPAGETWTLASFSCSNGRLFIHTMKGVVCLQEK